jgi:arylsulfatase A-like enzyme
LLGQSQDGRQELVTEGTQAKTVIRQGDWVCIPPHQGPAINAHTNTELGNSPDAQLYDLSQDIGQIRNLADEKPELVAAMSARLDEVRQTPTRP